MKKIICIAGIAAFAGVSAVRADILTSGSATINFSQSAWESLASGYGPGPVLTLTAFFNQAQANALNYDQVFTTTQASPSYTNQVYAMNGQAVTNLTGRTTQPTTFTFAPGQLTSHTGSIGLGGITRFDVYGGLGGVLLYGDYTLQYDSTRIALGGSGWYLKGNISPAAAAFDLLNVTVLETNNTLTISGDLGVSFEVAYFLYSTPGDTLANVGTFTFTGTTAPLRISSVASVGGNIIVLGTNAIAGSSYSVLSSTNAALPLSAWTTNATGAFDSTGACSNSIAITPGETARFFRLQQP